MKRKKVPTTTVIEHEESQDNYNTDSSIHEDIKLVKPNSKHSKRKADASKVRTKYIPPKLVPDYEKIRSILDMNCAICSVPFDTFPDATKHFKDFHNRSAYVTCCQKRLFNINRIMDHMEYHQNPEAYRCKICEKVFLDSQTLRYHLDRHAPEDEKIFKCDACPKTFYSKSLLNAHLRRHPNKDGTTFDCTQCDKKCKTIGLLQSHIRFVHTDKCTRICDICAKVFKSKQSLKMHTDVEHSGLDMKVQCQICKQW